MLVWRHVDYCFRLGGSECASVATCGIVSDWVARSMLVWQHVDYCFRLGGSECASVATCGLVSDWVARNVLVWGHVDYCFSNLTLYKSNEECWVNLGVIYIII